MMRERRERREREERERERERERENPRCWRRFSVVLGFSCLGLRAGEAACGGTGWVRGRESGAGGGHATGLSCRTSEREACSQRRERERVEGSISAQRGGGGVKGSLVGGRSGKKGEEGGGGGGWGVGGEELRGQELSELGRGDHGSGGRGKGEGRVVVVLVAQSMARVRG